MVSERVSPGSQEIKDDDEWLDWETRDDSIPLFKHMIAGKSLHNWSRQVHSDAIRSLLLLEELYLSRLAS